MKVWISGVHSGPDPSPGVGIARSLRAAFPDALLVGVDYSERSSGIHMDVFDQVCVHLPWDELDLQVHRDYTRSLISEQGSFVLSGLDVEIAWLARHVGPAEQLLLPPIEALHAVCKPEIPAASRLGMRVPPSIPAQTDSWRLHSFGRRHDWRLWVKSRFHDAVSAQSWSALRGALATLRTHWDPRDSFVQAHVPGEEHCVAFVAHEGDLLAAVAVEKRVLTETGKTWAARVTCAADDIVKKLAVFVRAEHWTGGGELEFVRTSDGEEFLFDFNPRFPAYVHGITLCGTNMPGLLLGRATRRSPLPTEGGSKQFTRVVVELPVGPGRAIPPLEQSHGSQRILGKHPSMQPRLARHLRAALPPRSSAEDTPRPVGLAHVVAQARQSDSTPRRAALDGVGAERIRSITTSLARLGPPVVVPALSVKTLPDSSIAREAIHAGWWAEVISREELVWAKEQGFSSSEIVLNGPMAAHSLARLDDSCAIVFVDSVEALKETRVDAARGIGVRLRPPFVFSRFGVPLEHQTIFKELIAALLVVDADISLGFHFHLPSDSMGVQAWWKSLSSFLDWTERIARLIGRGPDMLDLGGGWHPDDLESEFLHKLPAVLARVNDTLPTVRQVLIEPGKAVSAGGLVLISTVIEIRQKPGDALIVVVDASIADLPLSRYAPRRIVHVPMEEGKPSWVGVGSDDVLGAICMETDVLASGVRLPETARAGDRLIFLDAGAYEASMAWDFGRGVYRDGVQAPSYLLAGS